MYNSWKLKYIRNSEQSEINSIFNFINQLLYNTILYIQKHINITNNNCPIH